MKTQRDSRVQLYQFFNLDNRQGWMVNAIPRLLFLQESDLVPIVQEAGWASRPVWTGVETLTPTQDLIPRTSSPQQVSILSMLSRPIHHLQQQYVCTGSRIYYKTICFVYYVMVISQHTPLIYLCFTQLFEVAKFRLHRRKLIFSYTLSQLISDTAVFVMPGSPVTLINGTVISFPRNLLYIHHGQGNTFLIHFTSETHQSCMSYRYLTFFNRDEIVQPCRIGKDSHPEPVGQVLELIDDLS